jgi:hypothetical protein
MGFLDTLGITTDYRAKDPALDDDAARKARFASAIQAAQTRTGPQDQFRQDQNQLVGQLTQTATGQGPSAAAAMAKVQQDRAIAQQQAQAASARGVNPAMAARVAAQNGATASQAIAGQAGAQQIQEQQQAQQILSGTLQGARTQDIQVQGQIDDLTKQYEAMGLSAAEANQQAKLKVQEINAGIEASNSKNTSGLFGSLIGGAASLLSDKRLKKEIKPAGKKVKSFLDAISAEEWEYKDPKHGGSERHVGPMAQDLEKSEIGKRMVVETPEGKAVKFDGMSFAAILAAQAHLNKRLTEIESKKKGKR